MITRFSYALFLLVFLLTGWIVSGCTAIATLEDPAEITHRARNLLNFSIYNEEGQDLGEVADLILDLQTGKILYVVVGDGGLLELSGRLAVVPFRAFQIHREERTDDASLVLQTSEEDLQKSPVIDLNSWPPDLRSTNWDRHFVEYWKMIKVTGIKGAWPTVGTEGAASLDHLIDTDLFDRSGRQLGKVEDLILDPPTGKVTHVVVDAADEMEVGEKLVPLPLETLTLDEGGDAFVFMEDFGELRNAPNFDHLEDLTPERGETGWKQGVESYWEGQ